MNYTAAQIAEITGSKVIGDASVTVKNISFDSRNLFAVQERAFIAINTSQNSGEKYISDVLERGIRIIIAEHKTSDKEGITWILVENSVRFLQKLAKYHLKSFPDLKTVGITGSNGKTIVKEWLYQCIYNIFDTVKSPKSFNSQTGLPLSILQTGKKHEVGIFEAGISRPGEMAVLAAIFSPEIGVLTHIGTAHSANFSTESELIDEKLKFFKDSSVIIFNGDHPGIYDAVSLRYPDRKLVSYGLGPHNKLFVQSGWDNFSNEITVSYFDNVFKFNLSQKDEATLQNVLALIAELKELQVSNEEIVQKLVGLKAIEMRLESVHGVRGNLVVNDSFNLDVDSLKIAFQFIKEYKKVKKVLILTDIIDVKEPPDQLYKEVAQLVNEQ